MAPMPLPSATAYGAFTTALRQVLKARRITYAELAARLGVSEQTIKRVFNGDDCPMSRLTAICEAAGVNFFEVAQLAADKPEVTFELSLEQEEALAAEPPLHTFFDELRNGLDPQAIKVKHGITSLAEINRVTKD